MTEKYFKVSVLMYSAYKISNALYFPCYTEVSKYLSDIL